LRAPDEVTKPAAGPKPPKTKWMRSISPRNQDLDGMNPANKSGVGFKYLQMVSVARSTKKFQGDIFAEERRQGSRSGRIGREAHRMGSQAHARSGEDQAGVRER
jgi:hypothetical protein